MERTTHFQKRLEDEAPVFENDSVSFTSADPETKTLELSPDSGKTWFISKIRAYTDEAPSDNTNAGSKCDLDLFINGTSIHILKSYESEQIGDTYNTCGIAIDCESLFGQRLKITETTNGVYLTATKTGSSTPKLFLQVEGTEI